MKLAMPPEMLEVTRLTRAGRLGEATRLIQRLLRKAEEPERYGEASRAVGEPRALASPSVKGSAAQQTADWRHGPEGRAGRRADEQGAQQRARPTVWVPQGAQFITQTFTNRVGSRDYKLGRAPGLGP